jgi:hypothetical protein
MTVSSVTTIRLRRAPSLQTIDRNMPVVQELKLDSANRQILCVSPVDRGAQLVSTAPFSCMEYFWTGSLRHTYAPLGGRKCSVTNEGADTTRALALGSERWGGTDGLVGIGVPLRIPQLL